VSNTSTFSVIVQSWLEKSCNVTSGMSYFSKPSIHSTLLEGFRAPLLRHNIRRYMNISINLLTDFPKYKILKEIY